LDFAGKISNFPTNNIILVIFAFVNFTTMPKKATTIQEQIELLKSRGMDIPDENKAGEVLMDIGFYRFGFYAFPFEKSYPSLNNRTHKYKQDTSFADVVDLYYFDCDLRRILTNYLNRIEVNLRTYITYTVSNHYKGSPTWFVDSGVMKAKYVDDFEDTVYKTIRGNPAIKHHHSKYINDRFAPAWKTMEFMTLGNICSLFNNLKDNVLQKEIAGHYKCGLGVFINYIETIRVIRNSCAHGSCIYNINLAKAIKNTPQVPIYGDRRHNISGIVSVVSYMVGMISINRRNDMERDIRDLLVKKRSPYTKAIIEQCTGFYTK
jgi:abortive infection bacteriophage resistance protein